MIMDLWMWSHVRGQYLIDAPAFRNRIASYVKENPINFTVEFYSMKPGIIYDNIKYTLKRL